MGTSLQITDHWLTGDSIQHLDTPNKEGIISPRFCVLHFTAGSSAESSVAHFQRAKAKASAHLVIGRDGRIWQLVPFNRKAWHAGVSAWAGLEGLNSHSLGIELDNAGRLKKMGDQYQAWFGKLYPENEVIRACHKHELEESFWHAYTETQIAVALEVATLVTAHYGLEDILGHEDIAPQRKCDPGPAFPMASFKGAILGRSNDVAARYRVNVSKLNIRSGPGTQFPPLCEPLPLGTALSLTEMGTEWARVMANGPSRVEGWVCNRYIVQA